MYLSTSMWTIELTDGRLLFYHLGTKTKEINKQNFRWLSERDALRLTLTGELNQCLHNLPWRRLPGAADADQSCVQPAAPGWKRVLLWNKKASHFLFQKFWQSFKKAKKEGMKEMGSSERPALQDNPETPTVAFGWHPSGAGRPPQCLQNAGMFRRCSFCLTRKASSCVYKVTWWQGLF